MKAVIVAKLSLGSRILLAIVGAYGVATLVAILPLALPMSDVSAVAWGQIIGVLAALLVFLATFLIRVLWQAWLMIGGLFGLLFALCAVFVPNFLVTVGG